MFAVYGTLMFCGGLLLFFIMLHFHRRPGAGLWIRSRAVGEITVFVAMMLSLMGIALIGRFFIQLETQTFGSFEALVVTATLLGSFYIIRKSYLPPPPEDMPHPVERADSGTPRPSVPPASPPARKKAA